MAVGASAETAVEDTAEGVLVLVGPGGWVDGVLASVWRLGGWEGDSLEVLCCLF
jgi:hypothetical protein